MLVHSIQQQRTRLYIGCAKRAGRTMARQQVASMLAVALIVVGAFASLPTGTHRCLLSFSACIYYTCNFIAIVHAR
jgi:uncharacterized membrane protein YiaA